MMIRKLKPIEAPEIRPKNIELIKVQVIKDSKLHLYGVGSIFFTTEENYLKHQDSLEVLK